MSERMKEETMFTKYLDRVPKFLSLPGLLGLIGLAGVFDSHLLRFSALSFLSYVCYFRFLRWFIVKPQPPLTGTGILVPLLGIIVSIVPQLIFPAMLSTVPSFGFIGFAGFLGLFEPAGEIQGNMTI